MAESERSERLAAAVIPLGMNCTTSTDGSSHCRLRSPLNVTTRQVPDRQAAGSSCTIDSKTSQSWELINWSRQYEMIPGSPTSDSEAVPVKDTGPSFTLSSVPDGDVLNCASSGRTNGTVNGMCTSATPVNGSTAATTFTFDPRLGMIKVTQQPSCSKSS